MKYVIAVCLLGTSLSVHAAVLSVNYQSTAPNGTAATSHMFPNSPGTDWGYFTYTGNPGSTLTSTSAQNSADISGGRNFVLSTFNGNNLRGPTTPSSGSPASFFDFNNAEWTGTDNTGMDTRPTGLFNSGTGTVGTGVQMNLGGFTTQSQIQIWTFGYQATGIFEIFVNGATTSIYSQEVTVTNPTSGKYAQLFTLDYTPANSSEYLDIIFRMTVAGGANSHVGIQAIAVSPIPEPAGLSLLGIAGVLGFVRRRR